VLIDEIHTPDSSRYFYLKDFDQRQKQGGHQVQLSKEFAREWLMDNGFQGKEGQQIPDLTDEFIHSVSERYIELFEKITGGKFQKADTSAMEKRIEKNVSRYLR
jgi:phosphoribosylaminoimidazole-succinocarboxamide synthase